MTPKEILYRSCGCDCLDVYVELIEWTVEKEPDQICPEKVWLIRFGYCSSLDFEQEKMDQLIYQWLRVNSREEAIEVAVNTKNSLCKSYDTYGVVREFETSTGFKIEHRSKSIRATATFNNKDDNFQFDSYINGNAFRFTRNGGHVDKENLCVVGKMFAATTTTERYEKLAKMYSMLERYVCA